MLPLRDNVPTKSFPVVTVALIAANVVVWLLEMHNGVDHDVGRYGYYPCTVEGPCVQPASLIPHLPWWEGAFSSMFLHASWVHIGGNMLFLWIFGNNVEDSLGRVRFLIWYLAAGLAATAAQTIVTLSVSDAAGASIPNVGASGAIAGVLGAYFVLLPNARVLTVIVFVIREIPAWIFLGIWFLLQLLEGGSSIAHPESGGGTAFFAHIGGFAFGFITIRFLARRTPVQPAW